MKKISEQVEVLKELKKTSKGILKNMLPIMKELTSSNNDLSDEVAIRSKVSLEVSNLRLQEICLDLISDAETVKCEIDKFVGIIQESKTDLSNHIPKYPFLAGVWFGDAYDGEYEVEGLKILLKELKNTLSQVNEDWIIETAVSDLSR